MKPGAAQPQGKGAPARASPASPPAQTVRFIEGSRCVSLR